MSLRFPIDSVYSRTIGVFYLVGFSDDGVDRLTKLFTLGFWSLLNLGIRSLSFHLSGGLLVRETKAFNRALSREKIYYRTICSTCQSKEKHAFLLLLVDRQQTHRSHVFIPKWLISPHSFVSDDIED